MTTPDYDTDFYAWTQAQAAALRDGKWDTLDRANLAEEIESLGRSERYAIESHLQNLLTPPAEMGATIPRPSRAAAGGSRSAMLGLDIAKRAVGSLQELPRAVSRHRLSPRPRGRRRRHRPAAGDLPRGLPLAGCAGAG